MTRRFLGEFDLLQISTCRLQPLSENSNPVSAQNFFNLLVSETALDQFSSEVPRVRMVPQIGNEVWRCKFCSQLLPPRLRPLPEDEFKEIKADADAVYPDQVRDVLDMIDVVIERGFGDEEIEKILRENWLRIFEEWM